MRRAEQDNNSRQDDAAQELLPEDHQGLPAEEADAAQADILRADLE